MGKIILLFILFLYGFASEEKPFPEQMWNALQQKDYSAMHALGNQCVNKFLTPALEIQINMSKGDKYEYREAMPLNYFAECLYLDAEAYHAEKEYEIAKKIYKTVVRLKGARAGFPGWIWNPSEDAEDRLKQMEDDESKKP